MTLSACRALLISPRFTGPPHYMYKTTCEIVGAGYPTVAALLPASWKLRLIDRNFQKVEEAIDRAEWMPFARLGLAKVNQADALPIFGQWSAASE
jgi:hypothetical protein